MVINDRKTNRKTKDSVFTKLFSEKEYTLQLYKALHPEDVNTTEDDLTLVTITNVFATGYFNDLGFTVLDKSTGKSKLIILVEAQSKWSYNILIRSFIYLAETYKRFIKKNKVDVFGTKKVILPKPEMYVIYTGKRKDKPPYISLSKDFFEGENLPLEIKVKMIYTSLEGDIINQYILFCKVFDEQRENFPDDPQTAIRETIRICKDKQLLKDFIMEHEDEMENIMVDILTDQDYIWEVHVASEKKIAREEGLAEGRAEGRAEGIAEGRLEGKAEALAEIDELKARVKELEAQLAGR